MNPTGSGERWRRKAARHESTAMLLRTPSLGRDGGGQRRATPGRTQQPVALGKLGRAEGGAAPAAALSPRKRKMIAKKAAKMRWGKPLRAVPQVGGVAFARI